MSNAADEADKFVEQHTALAIQKAAQPLPPIYRAGGGECKYCGQWLKDGRRFCDAGCWDDWQRETDALLRNGGAYP